MSEEIFAWTDEDKIQFADFATCFSKYASIKDVIDSFCRIKKKLEKKDWEIMVFKYGKEEWVRENEETEYFNVNFRSRFERIHESVIPNDIEIIQVKRLSGNEVFSIGDKVLHNEYNDIGTIEKFLIDNSTMYVNGNDSTFLVKLSRLKKEKQPLFYSTDNVPIYDYDTYYRINDNFEISHNYADNLLSGKDYNSKYFSTKEAAENWILMNKPCLSLNDMLDNSENVSDVLRYFYIDKIKTLVKDKLK